MPTSVVPTREQSALLADLPADQPVVMINLLLYKRPDGAQSYARYAREVIPHLEAVGAKGLYAGDARAFVIGEGARPWWDAIVVVEYPSPQAFASMVTSEAYLKVHVHREAALERTELIATSSWGLGG